MSIFKFGKVVPLCVTLADADENFLFALSEHRNSAAQLCCHEERQADDK